MRVRTALVLLALLGVLSPTASPAFDEFNYGYCTDRCKHLTPKTTCADVFDTPCWNRRDAEIAAHERCIVDCEKRFWKQYYEKYWPENKEGQ